MKTTGTQYRYDLDGLRGISIALVVLFHVYVGRVSGGVDVFLLLSGFFFFGAQYRVLRGGSWATDPRVATLTFRNWDLPQRRQIFAGVRLATDPEERR